MNAPAFPRLAGLAFAAAIAFVSFNLSATGLPVLSDPRDGGPRDETIYNPMIACLGQQLDSPCALDD